MLTTISERVSALRHYLETHHLDAFILPTADPHLGEYQSEDLLRVTWLSGFHGENCMVIVTRDKAGIFVDGRFTVQVKQEVPDSVYEYGDITCDDPKAWLTDRLPSGSCIAIDASLFGIKWYQEAKAFFEHKGCELVSLPENPVDLLWEDRPAAPCGPIELFTGSAFSCFVKRDRVSAQIIKSGQDALLLTQPEDVNWLLNIRGCDIPFVRTAMSFALVQKNGSVDVFIDTDRLPEGFYQHTGEGVNAHNMAMMPSILEERVKSLPRIQLDPEQTNAWLYNLLVDAGAIPEFALCPVAWKRGCKEGIELEGMRAAHIQDGIAMCRFLAWLDGQVKDGCEQDECTLADKLQQSREGVEGFVDNSFACISAIGPNAAMCHYEPEPTTARKLGQDGMYLIDSGGHYQLKGDLYGTTDITRTVKVGSVSDEQRRRYTQVLQGHIALDDARFMPGTTGMQLDTVTRLPLWKEGINFNHGTGHGIGHFLSVHEFPPRINTNNPYGALEEGMCVSNEPGYYLEDGYGIRIENILAVRKAGDVNISMLAFEHLTFVPIDTRLLMPELLSGSEKAWINQYHQEVYEKIAPFLNEEETVWLKKATELVA
ncbi:Xaa-Pro dipeptidase [invertebrate metagenome]|uniref:Xaa-Pro dipeptidase n=1 Tax=invertebrate metagenome TaxID=1711999 RepID=A0A2H9TAN9_9ZZZZ